MPAMSATARKLSQPTLKMINFAWTLLSVHCRQDGRRSLKNYERRNIGFEENDQFAEDEFFAKGEFGADRAGAFEEMGRDESLPEDS